MSEMINRREIPLATEGENTFGLKVHREEWNTPSGHKVYWKYDLPDVAQIMGLTPDKKIIAISEFQPGVGGEYFHLPGETLKNGECPTAAAGRGLLEETGYKAGTILLLSSVLQDSGRSDRLIHLCLAFGCMKIQEGEKGIAVKLVEPNIFWRALMHNFLDKSTVRHGGGNTLKLATLAFYSLGWLWLHTANNP